jgi:hypothetical protein
MGTQEIVDTLSTQINGSTSASSFKGLVLWNIDGELYEMQMEDHVLWTRPYTKLQTKVGEASFSRRSESVDRPTLSKARKNNDAYVLNATWYYSGARPDTTITLTRDDLNGALSQVTAKDSWLDILLRNGSVKIAGNQSLLPDIASLTHIAPHPLPLPDNSSMDITP